MAPAPAIAVTDVRFTIQNREIIRGVSFNLARGDVFTILSSSGGGKTTLMKICAGLLSPGSGKVEINGESLGGDDGATGFSLGIRYVFEEGVLLSNLSIFENVALPLMYHSHIDEEELREKVMAELKFLQIDRYADELPASVNRSVRKRAHFAMAFILSPQIIIIDNPLEDFDQEGAQIVLGRLRRLNEEEQVTLLIASHTLDLISNITNRIGIMEGGRMVQSGALEKIVSMLQSMDDHKLGFIEDGSPV